MSEWISLLRSKGIDREFEAQGFDFDSLFSSALRGGGTDHGGEAAEPYASYEWLVKKVLPFGTVINAVPPDEQMGALPWEEWYVREGKPHHHVLYLEAPRHYDEIFVAPAQDDIHPPRTLGKRWYVIEDPDMTPALLRSKR